MRSIRILGSLFLTAFLILALSSYSLHDPAWNVVAPHAPIQNKGGIIGSYIADSFFMILGSVAWILPFIALHFIFMDLKKVFIWRSFLGWLGMIACLTYFLELGSASLNIGLPNTPGGWLGQALVYSGTWLFGGHGVFLGISCLFIGSFCLILNVAPLLIIEQLLNQSKNKIKIKTNLQSISTRTQIDVTENPVSLLAEPAPKLIEPIHQQRWQDQGQKLMLKLKEYGVNVKITAIVPGPVIVRFEMQLSPGERSAKVVALSKDLARALKIRHVNVIENIPGKSAIGLEIPIPEREIIPIKPLLEATSKNQLLPLAIGVCAQGEPVILDLAKLPHLLVAGSTGSGKSVGMNAMLLTLITQKSPEDLRLVLIDPKILEFARYEQLKHLACPVITEPTQAFGVLKWCVALMEDRYQILAKMHVRHITEYHQLRKKNSALAPMPFIVIVIDELADLMIMTKKAIEEPIARIAQKARACGIHLILATQRPSVDVITGLIKANIPARLAFAVSSKIDSRTIIDQQGAEHLLGMGDAYLLQSGEPGLKRVHGAYVSDDDCDKVLEVSKAHKIQFLMDLDELRLDDDASDAS